MITAVLMKFYLSFLLLLVQLPVFSQTDSLPGPASSQLPAQMVLPDSVFKADNPKAKPGMFRLKTLLDKRSQEVRILSRSAVVISAVSTVGVLTYAYGDEPVREFALSSRNAVTRKIANYIEPLGRSGNMIYAAGGVYAAGLVSRNQKLQRAGILAASGLLLNDLVTGQLKDEFQRRRPDATAENHYFEGGEGGQHHASFPSSHTSTAFTFATALATVYKNHRWVPPVAYSMATLVGLSRIHDNKHWATDVMAGAAVGFLTTKATNIILKQTEKQLEKRKLRIYLAPKATAGVYGLSLGSTF